VGLKEVHDGIWLVSFMDYDCGYFDLDTGVLEFWDRSRVRSATSRARNRPSTRHLR
jgi:hypothetical protein